MYGFIDTIQQTPDTGEKCGIVKQMTIVSDAGALAKLRETARTEPSTRLYNDGKFIILDDADDMNMIPGESLMQYAARLYAKDGYTISDVEHTFADGVIEYVSDDSGDTFEVHGDSPARKKYKK